MAAGRRREPRGRAPRGTRGDSPPDARGLHPSSALTDLALGRHPHHPLAELLEAARRYTLERRRRITFEYVMMPGVNMGRREIEQLTTQVPVVIAGTGATPEIARQTQTRVLEQDPVSAAGIIDRDHSTPR